jgi:hypothetical protein
MKRSLLFAITVALFGCNRDLKYQEPGPGQHRVVNALTGEHTFVSDSDLPSDHPLVSKTWRLICQKCGKTIYNGPPWPETGKVDHEHTRKCTGDYSWQELPPEVKRVKRKEGW